MTDVQGLLGVQGKVMWLSDPMLATEVTEFVPKDPAEWWLDEVFYADLYMSIVERNGPVEGTCKVDMKCLNQGACTYEGFCIDEYEMWGLRPHVWEGDNA